MGGSESGTDVKTRGLGCGRTVIPSDHLICLFQGQEHREFWIGPWCDSIYWGFTVRVDTNNGTLIVDGTPVVHNVRVVQKRGHGPKSLVLTLR